MTYDGFLVLGGNEIVNSARAYGYASSADCSIGWLDDPGCDNLYDSRLELPYLYSNITSAPWYDSDQDDLSRRFYGAYGLSISGVRDYTRTATITERTSDGGVIGGRRYSSHEVRVQVWLTADGADALDYGMTWLASAARSDACGQGGAACGVADMEFLTKCPPPRAVVSGAPQSDADYMKVVDPLRRYMRNVDCVSGPFTVAERQSSNGHHVGRLVEFTLVAEDPFVYGKTQPLELPPITPSAVQDIPYNLSPYPSAELGIGSVIVAENRCTNPSLEVNDTGWDGAVSGANLSATKGRVSGELAADGLASYRVAVTASGAGSGGTIQSEFEVDLDVKPGSCYSITVWAATVVMAGTPVLGSITFHAYWRATAGGATLRDDVLGTAPSLGGSVSVKSIAPPAGAAYVLIRPIQAVTSWSNGDVFNMYTDALAVTAP